MTDPVVSIVLACLVLGTVRLAALLVVWRSALALSARYTLRWPVTARRSTRDSLAEYFH